jgi:ssDNA-binding Zn-finger/Zn-ribbon topoisomerase 1
MIRVYPVPNCPKCGAPMKLRRPRTDDVWHAFWGCQRYPDCDGTQRPIKKSEEQLTFWEEQNVRYENV